MKIKKTCGNCKYAGKIENDLFCKKSSQDVYIAYGWGVEVFKNVKTNETCEEWKKK